MSTHDDVVAEERAALKRQRSIEKATRVRLRKIEQRKQAEQRKAERARQRAAERREREHQKSLADCDGQLSVVFDEIELAEAALPQWQQRGIAAVVAAVWTNGGARGFAVVES